MYLYGGIWTNGMEQLLNLNFYDDQLSPIKYHWQAGGREVILRVQEMSPVISKKKIARYAVARYGKRTMTTNDLWFHLFIG